MKFTLEVDCENAAFDGNGLGRELSRILRRLAKLAENGPVANGGSLMDVNGNRVGSWALEGE